MKRSYGTPKKKKHPEDEMFRNYGLRLPKTLHKYLEDQAKDLKVPTSHLIQRAIVNEILESTVPFKPIVKKPTTPFIDEEYSEEAQKLYTYLENFPGGISLELLAFAYKDAGLESPEIVAHAYRQLLADDAIVEFYPRYSSFEYPPDYRYAKVVGSTKKVRWVHNDEYKEAAKEVNKMLKNQAKYGPK